MSYTKSKHFPTGTSNSCKKTQFMPAESISKDLKEAENEWEKP
jgi:hypothetical protein